MRMLPCLLILALLPLRADAVADLKARLRALGGATPLKASVDHQIWQRNGDSKHPVTVQGEVNAWVEEGAQGLKLFWSRDLLQRALQEGRAKNADPEKTTPIKQAMASLDALTLQEYFNASEQILQDLDQAVLVEDRADTLDGKPARLLAFKLNPKLGAREKKYIKEMDATARIWLDPGGMPLGAEEQVKLKGKAMVVISFQQEQRDEYRFARFGDRLVTVSHTRESSGSGGGESGASRQVTRLSFS